MALIRTGGKSIVGLVSNSGDYLVFAGSTVNVGNGNVGALDSSNEAIIWNVGDYSTATATGTFGLQASADGETWTTLVLSTTAVDISSYKYFYGVGGPVTVSVT